jgi:hypothetical protein
MTPSDLQRTASTAAHYGRALIARQVERGAELLGHRLSSTADDLKRVAATLSPDDGIPGAATLALQGASVLGRIGKHLEHSDGDQLLGELEGALRAQPLAVAAAATALSFAATRIVKASRVAREMRHAIDDPVLGAAGNALDATAPARNRAAAFLAERPLALVAAAGIFGGLAGLLLPMAKMERKRVAPLGNELLDRARTIVRETVSAGRDVARDAADAAAASAREHGATIAQHAVEGTPFAARMNPTV